MVKKTIRILMLLVIFVLDIFLVKKDLFGKVTIELNGDENTTINVFDEYVDDGSSILYDNKYIKVGLYDLRVENGIDNNILGDYKVTYKYTYRKREYTKVRNVKVVDTEKPTIKVANEVVYKYNGNYSKVYYSAKDNYDGDLTKSVNVEYLESEVVLTVKDSSGNEEKVSIPVQKIDVEPLTLKLNGSPDYYIEVNGSYTEKGVTVYNGSKELKDYEYSISSDVDLTKEGNYEITYTVDYYGIKTSLFRNIYVYTKKEVPVREKTKGLEKVVYLTFDDGPCAYTEEFLNILDQYDAKATFFVTDQFNGKYLDLIKKEYDKGHKIAVHTDTHKYSIYASPETYINDFNTMNSKIESIIGEKTNLFRFPGGSSNTISRSYANGIMKYLANYMESEGYIYYDWNVDSTDGAGSGTEKIINNVLNGVRKNNESVVLMHDIHKSTLNALPTILETLKNEGYEFRTLDEHSMTAHHGINN